MRGKNRDMKLVLRKKDVILIAIIMLLTLLSFMFDNRVILFLGLTVFVIEFVYLFKEYGQNMSIIVFMISFFTFLLGYELLIFVGVKDAQYSFAEIVDVKTYRCILISLMTLFIAYLLTDRQSDRISGRTAIQYDSPRYRSVRSVSLFFFYAFFVFRLIVRITEFIYIQATGYSGFYGTYTFSGPAIILKLSSMLEICFYVFLATMPSKRQCRLPMGLYFLTTVISLASGIRNEFVVILLIYIFYFALRNSVNSGGEKWYGKKQLLFIIVMVPVLLTGMYAVSFTRKGEMHDFNIFSGVIDFIYQQGYSINVIKWTQELMDSIPDRLYSLGQLYEYFTDGNFISRLIFSFDTFTGQTAERALEGHRLSYFLTYAKFPWDYSMGYGVGGSFIAEAFHDFGYAGVAAFSTIYGFVLSKMKYMQRLNIWMGACAFIMLDQIIMAPRSYADSFISRVLDFSNIEILLLIYFISNFIYRRKNHERKGKK